MKTSSHILGLKWRGEDPGKGRGFHMSICAFQSRDLMHIVKFRGGISKIFFFQIARLSSSEKDLRCSKIA